MTAAPPPFVHTDPGTPESHWAGDPRFATLPPLSLEARGLEAVVVLAAHPDDETLGAGGLIASAGRTGLRVTVLVLSDGEASHPRSPSTTPARLGEIRRAEVTDAVRELCPVADLRFAGLPDGHISESVEQVVTLVVDLVGEQGATTLLVAPWRGDQHPDHEAAGRAAAVAAERTDSQLLEYPIWLWHWATPDQAPWDDLCRLDFDLPTEAAKQSAMSYHRSQVSPLSGAPGDETLLSAEVLAHFERSHEVYLAGPTVATDTAFETLHEQHEDPWSVSTSWYERRKRAVTLAALPDDRYERGLEIGCSVGLLAHELSQRCAELVALDRSASALERARRRLAGLTHVHVERAVVPQDWPAGRFDLIVLSEAGYFLSPGELSRLITRVRDSLTPKGHVVLCHWRHPIVGWPLDGERVHERWSTAWRSAPLVVHRENDFLLEVFGTEARVGGMS